MTQSGKTASDENFPVGSWLIAAAHRPHVQAYYVFARTADDIADAPMLSADEKLRRLDALEAALANGRPGLAAEVALHLRASLLERGIPLRHGLDLLDAFRQDVTQHHYADWAELMAYCERSAAPVGRFLLDLHGEAKSLYPTADALCLALQVINHLQDCGDDYRQLGRVYLPADWLAADGVELSALVGERLSPGLRQVVNRCLDAVDGLLARSRPLPSGLVHPRLALETGAIQHLAEDLVRQLRQRDPLAERVTRRRPALMAHAALGAAKTALGRLRR